MDRAGVWMVGGDVAARDPLGEIVVKLDAHSYGLKKMTTPSHNKIEYPFPIA